MSHVSLNGKFICILMTENCMQSNFINTMFKKNTKEIHKLISKCYFNHVMILILIKIGIGMKYWNRHMVKLMLMYEDIHNSWLYCFTNPLEIGTHVPLSHRICHTYGWRCESETRVPISRGLVKQYNQELCISSYILNEYIN